MKLYMFQVAPNPTRVRLYIAEKQEAGTLIPVEEVSLNLPKGEHRTPEHRARDPFGKLPVLERDDGSFLTESLAIIEYLEELYPRPSFFGDSPEERAQSRRLERICELSVVSPITQIVHATKSPLGLPPSPAVAERAQGILSQGLGVVDDVLADGRPHVAGDRLTHADCTLQAGFQFARFCGLDVLAGYKNAQRWDEAYRGRPAAKSVLVV